MHRYLDDVSEKEYHTMMERLKTLETEPIVNSLYDWFDTETAILMEKLGVTNGDIAPDQSTELDNAIRKVSGMVVEVAYQNIEKGIL